MRYRRLALVTPNASAYSETFIQAHINKIRDVYLVLSGDDLPNHSSLSGKLGEPSKQDRLKARFGSPLSFKQVLVKQLKAELVKHEIDMVMAEYGVCGNAMLEVCSALGIPLVTHFHGYDAFRDDVLSKVGAYQKLLNQGQGFIAVSREMEQQLIRLGAPADRVCYNSCGVEIPSNPKIPVSARPPHFMGVGRFVDKKMPVLTILAFREALKKVPEMKLTMVGDGPLYGACKALVQAYDLHDSVMLPGKLPHADVLELVANSRGFVQHSIVSHINDHEGTPVAVLEAMAAGVPVIATAHAGIKDQITSNENGLLCAEFDVSSMAEHIVLIAGNSTLAQQLGDSGRQHAIANVSMDLSIERLQNFLDQCSSR